MAGTWWKRLQNAWDRPRDWTPFLHVDPDDILSMVEDTILEIAFTMKDPWELLESQSNLEFFIAWKTSETGNNIPDLARKV